jgi:2'-5' RNA ligase
MPITLTIDKLEAFTTGKGDEHVVCLTSSQPPASLLELANEARACADCLGANYDKRPFKLHITLCRIPSDAISLENLQSLLSKISLPAFDCRLDDVQYRYQGCGDLIDKWNL